MFKQVIKYNIVHFITSGWFIRFWKLSVPFAVIFSVFGDPSLTTLSSNSLWTNRDEFGALAMIVLLGVFSLFYPFAIWWTVTKKKKVLSLKKAMGTITKTELETLKVIQKK